MTSYCCPSCASTCFSYGATTLTVRSQNATSRRLGDALVAMVVRWSGRQARALREARRMSVRAFAAHLGVTVAAVSNWEKRADQARLRYETQQILDTDLARAPADVRARFEALLAVTQAPAPGTAFIAHAEASDGQPEQSGRWDGPAERYDVADTRGRVDVVQSHEEPGGFDLWEFNEALDSRRIGAMGLRLAEASAAQLDERYAELPPDVVLPRVSLLLRKTVRVMREPQSVAHRRRLVALAGRLAGLRAWLLFDLAHHDGADAWYDAAIRAAREAEDAALCGWLCGARSLIPSYRHDHQAALALIEQGQSMASGSGDATVTAWLHALEARGRAGLRDRRGFGTAQRRADRLLTRTRCAERRHGMDFNGGELDLMR